MRERFGERTQIGELLERSRERERRALLSSDRRSCQNHRLVARGRDAPLAQRFHDAQLHVSHRHAVRHTGTLCTNGGFTRYIITSTRVNLNGVRSEIQHRVNAEKTRAKRGGAPVMSARTLRHAKAGASSASRWRPRANVQTASSQSRPTSGSTSAIESTAPLLSTSRRSAPSSSSPPAAASS